MATKVQDWSFLPVISLFRLESLLDEGQHETVIPYALRLLQSGQLSADDASSVSVTLLTACRRVRGLEDAVLMAYIRTYLLHLRGANRWAALLTLADLLMASGESAESVYYYQAAKREAQDREDVLHSSLRLARSLLATGALAGAEEEYRRSRALLQELERPDLLPYLQVGLAWCSAAGGDYGVASCLLHEALIRMTESAYPLLVWCDYHLVRARALRAGGDPAWQECRDRALQIAGTYHDIQREAEAAAV